MLDVTFLIPAYNEEQSLGPLLEDITNFYPNSKVLVVDNNSKDKTSEIAKNASVDVIFEKKQGKGHAIKTGFEHVDSKYAIMLDADYTYDPKEAEKMVLPIMKGDADVVMGCRLNKNRQKGSITTLNLFGNHVLCLTASLLYSRVSDVCTGYWAFNQDVINHFQENGIKSQGFELEVEMFIKISKNNFRIKEIPITYRRRINKPKLNSLEDGWIIFKNLIYHKLEEKNLKNDYFKNIVSSEKE